MVCNVGAPSSYTQKICTFKKGQWGTGYIILSSFNGDEKFYVDDQTMIEKWGAVTWLADQSGNYNHLLNATEIEQGLWVTDSTAIKQDGLNDVIEGGNVGTIKGVVIRCYIDGAENILDLDGGTHTITTSGNDITANNWSSPSYFVNGISGNTYTPNQWNVFGVQSSTGFSATAFNTDVSEMWYTSIIALKYNITEAEMLSLKNKLNE